MSRSGALVVRLAAGLGLAVGGAAADAAPGARRLAAGARIGVVASSLEGGAIDASRVRVSTKVGPTAALLVRWTGGPWSLEGELGVSDRGAVVEVAGEEVALHLYTLDFPLVAARGFEVSGPVTPRLVAGLAPSLRFAGGALADPGGPGGGPALDRRLDVAVVLGVGAALEPAGGGTWLLDLRYLGGVRDLVAADGDAADVRDSAVAVTAAYVY